MQPLKASYFRLDFIHLLFAMGFFFAGYIISSFISYIAFEFLVYDAVMKYVQPLLFAVPFVFTLWVYYLVFLKADKIEYNFHFTLSEWYLYPIMILMFFGAVILNEPIAEAIPKSGLNGFLDKMYGMLEAMEKQLIQYPVAMSVSIAIMAPIFEELFFRGFILKGLLNQTQKPALSIVISALIFALVHINPWQFVGALILGCVLGFVYYRTRSLLNVMLLHFLNNALGIYFFFNLEEESYSELTETEGSQALLIGLFVFLIFGFIFNRLTQKNQWKLY